MGPQRNLDNASQDYAGGSTISTAEELEQYLAGGTQLDEEGNPIPKPANAKGGKEKPPVENVEGGEGEDGNGGKGKDANKQPNANDNPDGNEEGEEEEEQAEHKSIVHYLNEEFKLGLNVEGLPENLEAAQEAQLVKAIFQRAVTGMNAKLAEYKTIDTVLQDKEVADFIAAKREGKTLKDYVQEFASTPQGLATDAVTSKYLKVMNPSLTDDELKDMVNTYREKGKLDKLETDARKYFTEQDAREAQTKQQKAEAEIQALKEQREADLTQYKAYLMSTKDISGVPVDDEMRKVAFAAASKVIDPNTGETWLDRALMEDKNVFLATMGILYMEKLLNTKRTAQVNKGKQALTETLFETPEKLLGGNTGGRDKEFNAAIANQW